MRETVFYPTHTCFTDAIEIIQALVRKGGPVAASRLTLVHAIVKSDEECRAHPDLELAPGATWAHAWVEERGRDGVVRCYEAGHLNAPDGPIVGFAQPAAQHYGSLNTVQAWRYSCRELVRLNHATGHYGPWRPELRDMCIETDRRREGGTHV